VRVRPHRTLRVGAACVREAPPLRMADGRPAVRMRPWRRRRRIASSKAGARLRRVRVHVRACVQLRVRAWPPLQQRCRIAAAWFERRRRGVILGGGVCLAEVAMDSVRCECGWLRARCCRCSGCACNHSLLLLLFGAAGWDGGWLRAERSGGLQQRRQREKATGAVTVSEQRSMRGGAEGQHRHSKPATHTAQRSTPDAHRPLRCATGGER